MIRVLIADDDKLVRAGLNLILQREKDMLVVGEARNGQEAIDLSCELEPGVILMDIHMSILDGLQATLQICGNANRAQVIIFSSSYDEHLLRTALANGARGYVAKHEGMLKLPEAIRTVFTGLRYFSPSLAALLLLLG